MGILSKILSRFGGAPASPSGRAPDGALAGPPDLSAAAGAGGGDLLLFIDHRVVLPLGSQVVRASALHRGGRVGLEVELGPDWREQTIDDRPAWEGLVTWRSVGTESDALLRSIDALYGTQAAPKAMAKLTDFSCVTLSGDPRELAKGPVRARLLFEAGEEEEPAALFMNVDLAARRLEIVASGAEQRLPIVRALTAK